MGLVGAAYCIIGACTVLVLETKTNQFSELRCDERLWEQRREVAARGLQQVHQRQHQLRLREED